MRIITVSNVPFRVTFLSSNLLMVGIAVWSISTTTCARAASSLDAPPRATSSTTPWWSTAHRWEHKAACMTNTCHPASDTFTLLSQSYCKPSPLWSVWKGNSVVITGKIRPAQNTSKKDQRLRFITYGRKQDFILPRWYRYDIKNSNGTSCLSSIALQSQVYVHNHVCVQSHTSNRV